MVSERRVPTLLMFLPPVNLRLDERVQTDAMRFDFLPDCLQFDHFSSLLNKLRLLIVFAALSSSFSATIR